MRDYNKNTEASFFIVFFVFVDDDDDDDVRLLQNTQINRGRQAHRHLKWKLLEMFLSIRATPHLLHTHAPEDDKTNNFLSFIQSIKNSYVWAISSTHWANSRFWLHTSKCVSTSFFCDLQNVFFLRI